MKAVKNNLFSKSFANSEDPDEMLHYTAFHWGLNCFQRKNNIHSYQARLNFGSAVAQW